LSRNPSTARRRRAFDELAALALITAVFGLALMGFRKFGHETITGCRPNDLKVEFPNAAPCFHSGLPLVSTVVIGFARLASGGDSRLPVGWVDQDGGRKPWRFALS
jgi:hypothetical protein